MAKPLDQTGVMQVDGAWATALKYEGAGPGAGAGIVDLRFMQGRTQVARLVVPLERLAQTVGPDNGATIAKHLATDSTPNQPTVRGELRGRRLRYGEVYLADALKDAPRPASPNREPASGASPAFTLPKELLATEPEPERDTLSEASGAKVEKPSASTATAPEPVVKRYLVVKNRYHFADETLAFTDQGKLLTVATQNTQVLKDLVTIAQARGWKEVQVSGSAQFRRSAWQAATAAGLKVSGYTPTEIERLAAERGRAKQASVQPPSKGSQAASAARSPRAHTDTDAAPVKQPAPDTRARDEEVAAAIRSAATTREELQLKYPTVNRAVFQTLSAQDAFAEAYVKAGLIRESDRAQVIAQMRDWLAKRVEQDAIRREPDANQVNELIRRSVATATEVTRALPAGRSPTADLAKGMTPPAREERMR